MSERTRRRGIALLGTVLAVLLAPSPALAGISPIVPPEDGALGYRSGLEPGSTLAGFTLPMDWSQREAVCPTPDDAAHLVLRQSPTSYPDLCPGDVSEAVAHLQRLLTEKRLYRGPITSEFDRATQYAVWTFHKIIGPSHSDPRTARAEWIADPPPDDWTTQDWLMLEAFQPTPPKYRAAQPDRVEVDIGHQVLYLIHDDEVEAIIPVSTGAGYGERGCTSTDGCNNRVTPRTERMPNGSSFYTEHAYGRGWSPLPGAWSIYKAIFYKGQFGEWNYGIHGYRQVPNYPASHGCTRVTVWDMDYLRPSTGRDAPDARVWVGMPIHLWDA